ncbi:peptidoglycan-binding protein [Streptomyces sp. NPDC001404]|uniref:peptidoglycan-binding domain-containing protein n=1 Tax=Streptomyces sp. NPDC001404 TaxID=3364571 RepID=UPI0036B8C813
MSGQPVRTVRLEHLLTAARTDPIAPQGHTTYGAEVLIIQQALNAEGLLDVAWVDGNYGPRTVAAYAAWQRLYGCSDGIPDPASLAKLGERHAFTITI